MWNLFRSEKGNALVELALVAPVFLLLTLGAVDFAMAIQSYTNLDNATREAAMWVVRFPDLPLAQAQTRAAAEIANAGLNPGDATVTFNQASYSSGDQVIVTINYDHPLIFGGFLNQFGAPGFSTVPFVIDTALVVK